MGVEHTSRSRGNWRIASIGLSLLVFCSCSRGRDDAGFAASGKASPKGGDSASASDAKPGIGGNYLIEPEPLPVLFDAPKFRLTDQTGGEFGAEELAGRVWVANVMFTHCTATCPRQTAMLAEIQEHAQKWPDWDRVRLVSISVDPQRDTVARLAEYADEHEADQEHWKFLTGERSELLNLSKDGFKLSVGDAANSSGPITHSPLLLLIDAEMRVRGIYDIDAEGDFVKLLGDLRLALAEAPPGLQATHVGVPNEVFDPPWMEARKQAQFASWRGADTFHKFAFTDKLAASGIAFVNRAVADAAGEFKRNHYDHATGVAVADIDGDELLDIYFVSQVGGNQLWRNAGGGRFEDFTSQAGVARDDGVGVSASFADTDNDGDSDLFVTTTRYGNSLFENDGKGHFRDVTAEAGLEYSGHSSSADFFDYDRDGRLDLFLTNVGKFTTDEIGQNGAEEIGQNGDFRKRDLPTRTFPYYVGMKEAFGSHLIPERTERSILYHNEGNNRFRDVSEEVGLVSKGWSGDATPIDLNEDGWIDLYVLNMQGEDECYINLEGARFELRSRKLFSDVVWGGMGVKAFDYNNDGRIDLFVTNMHADMFDLEWNLSGEHEKLKPPQKLIPANTFLQTYDGAHDVFGNALYENEGNGRYREVSDETNTETYWPWGPSVGDLNADGFQDLFITSCMNFPFRYQVNSLLLNERGKKFHDAEFILGVEPRIDGKSAAPWFESEFYDADSSNAGSRDGGRVVVWGALGSRSSVLFDLDQDGDLDIITNDFNTPPMVLISDLSERKPDFRYLKVRLQGARSNRDGLGARVEVVAGGRKFTQVHDGQSGYLSQSAMPLYFGLGDATSIDRIKVQWSTGELQEIEGPIRPNRQISIHEDRGLNEE